MLARVSPIVGCRGPEFADRRALLRVVRLYSIRERVASDSLGGFGKQALKGV